MNAGDWIGAIGDLVQMAVVVGGIVWAYYKFVRGRTFARRSDIAVTGTLIETDNRSAVRVRATLKNTGTTDIPLRAKVVYLYSVDAEGLGKRPDWAKQGVAKVFESHAWIEAQESIEDEVLIPLNDAARNAFALWLELRVYEQAKKQGQGGIRWTANAVITGPSANSPAAAPAIPTATGASR
jgi:hypothetical protein